MRRLYVSLAFLLGLGPAYAQDATPAQDLIAQAGVEDIFEPLVSENADTIRVRHRGSGLVCTFHPPQPHRLVVFPGLPRGEDIGCDYRADDAFVTLYATRYAPPQTNAEQMREAVSAIVQRFQGGAVQPVESQITAAPEGRTLPESEVAAFLINQPGQPRLYTHVAVTSVNGWAIKLRFSMYAPDETAANAAQVWAAMLWMQAMLELEAKPGP